MIFLNFKGYRIPHTAMTMYLSKSKRKRELATVCRMGFEMCGILLSLVLQGFIIGDPSSNCERLNSNFTSTSYFEASTTVLVDENSLSSTFIPSTYISSTDILSTSIPVTLDLAAKSLNFIVEDLTFKKAPSAFEIFYNSQKYFAAAVIVAVCFFIAQGLLLVGTKESAGNY
jgi:hypothetical protein